MLITILQLIKALYYFVFCYFQYFKRINFNNTLFSKDTRRVETHSNSNVKAVIDRILHFLNAKHSPMKTVMEYYLLQ